MQDAIFCFKNISFDDPQNGGHFSCGKPVPHLGTSTAVVCKGPQYVASWKAPLTCTIVGSETFGEGHTYRKRCKKKGGCVHCYRANFAYIDSTKVNTISFNDMKKAGVYLVTNNFGFTMKYLELSYLRLLRGNLAPGQEGGVRLMIEGSIHPQRFQAHLLRALEGYALARKDSRESHPISSGSSI